MSTRTFRHVLRELAGDAQSTVEKGRSFERLVKAFLEQDKAQSERFARVWLWGDWPGNGGRHDTGIDLVAEERDTGGLVAIQCKFYGEDNSIALEQLNKFLTAYGAIQFASGIMVATTDNWTRNAEAAIREARDKPVTRWGPDIFENSSIDWSAFDLDNPSGAVQRPTKDLRDYQQEALNAVIDGLQQHDRGKLIMACGTGKTFTALRIAERQVGAGGTMLFLTPSISLLSQSLLDWANDADTPLKTFAVCSDTKAGKTLQRRRGHFPLRPEGHAFHQPRPTWLRDTAPPSADEYMTVIFSTYQSLDVVAEAQRNGLPKFDLIICDEAPPHHRRQPGRQGRVKLPARPRQRLCGRRQAALHDRHAANLRRPGQAQGQRKPAHPRLHGQRAGVRAGVPPPRLRTRHRTGHTVAIQGGHLQR